MNSDHEASRTLVKSPPELWTECSDAETLARHIGDFGEIRITRLEPQTAVAWEGERASGTVRLEPSGWGTKVILTAQLTSPRVQPTAPPEPARAPEPEAAATPEPEPEAVAAPEPEPAVAPAPVPEPAAAPAPVVPHRSGGVFAKFVGLFRPAQPAPTPARSLVSPPAPTPVTRTPPAPVASAPAPAPTPPALDPTPAPLRVLPDVERAPSEPAPGPQPSPELDPAAVLAAALDSLGQAHHRPFSRG